MKIGYCRVSTTEQNTDLQIDALANVGCHVVYQEKISGVSKCRPELERALKSLRKGDEFIVWRLDRLGRSLKDLISIVSTLEEKGIVFKSITESIDTSSTTGKLVFNIFASLSEFERNLIAERTQAGLAAARARGRLGGRPPKLSKEQIKKAKSMLLSPEITKTEVAKMFDVSRVTLNKALAESYT